MSMHVAVEGRASVLENSKMFCRYQVSTRASVQIIGRMMSKSLKPCLLNRLIQ